MELPVRPITQIIIHCSATKANINVGVEDIRRWHRERGWSDIGYHFVIRRDGTCENGRLLVNPGAHTAGYNANSVGVCLVGGLSDNMMPEANYTPKQWVSLGRVVRELSRMFPQATVHGHKEFASKACPCFEVSPWWQGERKGDGR